MAETSARRSDEPPALSPFARNVDKLRAAGYGGFLHAIVPPHLTVRMASRSGPGR